MDIKSILTPELLSYLLSAVIVPFIIKVLLAIGSNIKGKTHDNKINSYIDTAEKAIETSVIAVSQIYVDTLKKSGSFDQAAKEEAFYQAKSRVMSILSDIAKDELTKFYGDLNQWIDSKIEYYVNNKKS